MVLTLGLELFYLLLELKDGVQLSGVAQDGTFANLEVFTQRLAREDARDLHGWHPSEEDRVFRGRVLPREGRQVLVREPRGSARGDASGTMHAGVRGPARETNHPLYEPGGIP